MSQWKRGSWCSLILSLVEAQLCLEVARFCPSNQADVLQQVFKKKHEFLEEKG
jgi:hypothetical protein